VSPRLKKSRKRPSPMAEIARSAPGIYALYRSFLSSQRKVERAAVPRRSLANLSDEMIGDARGERTPRLVPHDDALQRVNDAVKAARDAFDELEYTLLARSDPTRVLKHIDEVRGQLDILAKIARRRILWASSKPGRPV
jgi:hypothetical protein